MNFWIMMFILAGTQQTPQEIWLTKAGQILQKKVEEKTGEPLSEWYVVVKKIPGGHIGYFSRQINGTFKVTISPKLTSEVEILATLLHELVHVALKKSGHGSKFKKLASSLGLEGEDGNMGRTYANNSLKLELSKIIKTLGPYPE